MANPVFYPNVSRVPSQSGNVSESRKSPGESEIKKGEFDQSLNQAIEKTKQSDARINPANLEQISQGLKFSAHATQRLRDRQISFDPEMMTKMNDAINKAEAKGVQDTLILTDKAALIVNVPNRTVVTAMDKNNLNGNIFTNIDGAVII